MYKIIIFLTAHTNIGKCNSEELYKIIKIIEPEIIFEEIPYDRFDTYYIEKTAYTLESYAINMYLQNCKIEHIPVDTYNFSDDIKEKIDYMYKAISENSKEYNEILRKQYFSMIKNGFLFLNSQENKILVENLHIIEEEIIKKLNDEELFEIYKLWMDITNNRENEIINNIYDYSYKNNYNNALLLIGADHGESIYRKMQDFNNKEKLKINWTFHNF
jgi:hypothetical protein